MSEWKEKLKKQKEEKELDKKSSTVVNLDSFTKSHAKEEPPESPHKLIVEPSEANPLSPAQLEKEMHMGLLTSWKDMLFAPRLTSDMLRVSHSLLFIRMCRLRKEEILEDLLRICLSNLPPETSIKYIDSYKAFYGTIEEQLKKQKLSS